MIRIHFTNKNFWTDAKAAILPSICCVIWASAWTVHIKPGLTRTILFSIIYLSGLPLLYLIDKKHMSKLFKITKDTT
jgi:hypothetical protein